MPGFVIPAPRQADLGLEAIGRGLAERGKSKREEERLERLLEHERLMQGEKYGFMSELQQEGFDFEESMLGKKFTQEEKMLNLANEAARFMADIQQNFQYEMQRREQAHDARLDKQTTKTASAQRDLIRAQASRARNEATKAKAEADYINSPRYKMMEQMNTYLTQLQKQATVLGTMVANTSLDPAARDMLNQALVRTQLQIVQPMADPGTIDAQIRQIMGPEGVYSKSAKQLEAVQAIRDDLMSGISKLDPGRLAQGPYSKTNIAAINDFAKGINPEAGRSASPTTMDFINFASRSGVESLDDMKFRDTATGRKQTALWFLRRYGIDAALNRDMSTSAGEIPLREAITEFLGEKDDADSQDLLLILDRQLDYMEGIGRGLNDPNSVGSDPDQIR